jgi:hypothetical protein
MLSYDKFVGVWVRWSQHVHPPRTPSSPVHLPRRVSRQKGAVREEDEARQGQTMSGALPDVSTTNTDVHVFLRSHSDVWKETWHHNLRIISSLRTVTTRGSEGETALQMGRTPPLQGDLFVQGFHVLSTSHPWSHRQPEAETREGPNPEPSQDHHSSDEGRSFTHIASGRFRYF